MLKKILAISLLMTIATTSQANPNHYMNHSGRGHYQNHMHTGNHYRTADWVIPAVIGSAVVYAIATRPAQPVIQNPPQYPNPPYGFHYEQILDANCNCYKLALVPN